MFSTWEWHTREGKTQMRTYIREKNFSSGTEEISIFFSGTEGILSLGFSSYYCYMDKIILTPSLYQRI
jgi:hypothetical protein